MATPERARGAAGTGEMDGACAGHHLAREASLGFEGRLDVKLDFPELCEPPSVGKMSKMCYFFPVAK